MATILKTAYFLSTQVTSIKTHLHILDHYFPGPYTVFAPTDGAFAVLGQTLNSLTNAQLRRLLYYHVTGGFVLASAIMAPTNYTSLLGENLLVSRVNNVSIILKFSWCLKGIVVRRTAIMKKVHLAMQKPETLS